MKSASAAAMVQADTLKKQEKRKSLDEAFEILENQGSFIGRDDSVWQACKDDLGLTEPPDLGELDENTRRQIILACTPLKQSRLNRLLNISQL